MVKKFDYFMFTVLLTIFALVSFGAIKGVTTYTFQRINQTILEKDAEVALTAFSRRIETIEQMNLDWSQWDDSYYFIQDLNKNYIEANLTSESLEAANVNFMLFFNKAGDVRHKESISLGALEDTSLPAEVMNHTKEGSKIDIDKLIKEEKQQAGLLYTTNGTFLYSVSPITLSDKSLPANGALMMGRYINDADEEELRNITGLDLNILDFTDIGRYYEEVTLEDMQKGTVTTKYAGGNVIHVLARDSWGHPAKVISIKHDFVGSKEALTLELIITGISVLFAAIFAKFSAVLFYNAVERNLPKEE